MSYVSTRTMRRALSAVALVLISGPVWALAEDVDLDVRSIRATNKNNDVSQELKPLEQRLKRLGFSGFKLERHDKGKVGIGGEYKTDLIADYKASVTPTKSDAKTVTLHIVVKKGNKTTLDTNVTVKRGESQLIVGPALPDGDTLVIAVSGK